MKMNTEFGVHAQIAFDISQSQDMTITAQT